MAYCFILMLPGLCFLWKFVRIEIWLSFGIITSPNCSIILYNTKSFYFGWWRGYLGFLVNVCGWVVCVSYEMWKEWGIVAEAHNPLHRRLRIWSSRPIVIPCQWSPLPCTEKCMSKIWDGIEEYLEIGSPILELLGAFYKNVDNCGPLNT